MRIVSLPRPPLRTLAVEDPVRRWVEPVRFSNVTSVSLPAPLAVPVDRFAVTLPEAPEKDAMSEPSPSTVRP
jgi:hypothetical protein